MSSKSIWYYAAVAALTVFVTAQDIPTPTAQVSLNAPTPQGCFSSGEGMDNHGPYIYQSQGNCQPICVLLEKPAFAVVNGTHCYCGNFIPPANAKVSDDECKTPCVGYPLQTCGGKNRWEVLLSGINQDSVPNFDPKNPGNGKPSGTKTGAQIVTVGSTVIMTVPPNSNKGPSPASKAGIAIGVVVGILALAAIIGGVFFFLRQKRRRDVEEHYRRAAAINEFVGKSPQTSHSSITDARLDPEVMFRRQSDGSIADNQDYSRRILQVRNPDGL